MPNLPVTAAEEEKEEKTFDEISQQARAQELSRREKEQQLGEEIARKRSLKDSRGKVQQQLEHDELKKVHDELISRYRESEFSKPYSGNYKPKKIPPETKLTDTEISEQLNYEYEMLVRGAYSKLFDSENGVIKQLGDFLSLDVTSPDVMKTQEHTGQNNLADSFKALSRCVKLLEKSLAYTRSDEDKEPTKLLSDLYDLQNTIERNYYGRLFVPANSVKYDENGKKIHRVVQKKRLKDPKNPKAGEEWVQPQIPSKLLGDDISNQDAFSELGAIPLFDHAPNESDVEQGHLGNCYMVSSLSAIAGQCPDFIRENMRFNFEDNTVTVRFFTKSMEPVYVTMDYSLPMWDEEFEDGTTIMGVPFSRRSIWVALYEKAFVLSGLASGELSAAEKGTLNASYEKIVSGNELDFLRMVTGKYGHYDLLNDGWQNDYDQIGNDIQKFSLEHLPKGKDQYSKDERDVYDRISAALVDDRFVTAGAQRNDKYPEGSFAGIVFGHAYAVTGVASENGKLYIQVRNPHGTKGRTYDQNDNPVEQKNVDGFSKLELHDFVKTFHDYTIAKNDVSFLNRAQKAARDDMRFKYGKMVKLIDSVLNEHDNVFLSKYKNSEQFNDFRIAAKQAAAYCKSEHASAEQISEKISILIESAKVYKDYRDNNPKANYNDNAKRSIYRYEMAAFVSELEQAFNSMETQGSKTFDTVTPEEIIIKIRENGMGQSKAAQAAFKHFKENYQPKPATKAPEPQKAEKELVI